MSVKKTKSQQSEPATTPVDRIRVGLVTASMWERQGKNGSFYTVTFDRRYRDSEGSWKSSHSYDAEDLLALIKAADVAHTEILQAQKANAQ